MFCYGEITAVTQLFLCYVTDWKKFHKENNKLPVKPHECPHTNSSLQSIVEGILKRTESNVALARRNIATKLYFMLFDQSLQKSSWL